MFGQDTKLIFSCFDTFQVFQLEAEKGKRQQP